MSGRRPTGGSEMTQHTDRPPATTPASPAAGPADEADSEALRELAAAELVAARDRTTLLTSAVDDADLVRQHSPLMSPLVWDLAHIANQEELWLLRAVGGRDPIHPEINPLYDAFEDPRAEQAPTRPRGPGEARAYGDEGPRRGGAPAARVRRGAGRGRFRLRVRHGRPARGPARGDHARPPPAALRPG